jgi:hypothetical protein
MQATVAAKGVVAGRPPGAAASAAALPQSARGLSSSALPDADVCDMKERLALVLRCDVRKTHLGARAAACASQCGPCAVHVDSDSLGSCLFRARLGCVPPSYAQRAGFFRSTPATCSLRGGFRNLGGAAGPLFAPIEVLRVCGNRSALDLHMPGCMVAQQVCRALAAQRWWNPPPRSWSARRGGRSHQTLAGRTRLDAAL